MVSCRNLLYQPPFPSHTWILWYFCDIAPIPPLGGVARWNIMLDYERQLVINCDLRSNSRRFWDLHDFCISFVNRKWRIVDLSARWRHKSNKMTYYDWQLLTSYLWLMLTLLYHIPFSSYTRLQWFCLWNRKFSNDDFSARWRHKSNKMADSKRQSPTPYFWLLLTFLLYHVQFPCFTRF